MYHYNSTQYCKIETVFSIFPFLQTNIKSQMWPCGGKGGGAFTIICACQGRLKSVGLFSRSLTERDFCDLFWLRMILTFDLLTPNVECFMPLPTWMTCANWHQNQFINFQNIVFLSLVTNKLMDGQMNIKDDNIMSPSLFFILIFTLFYLH